MNENEYNPYNAENPGQPYNQMPNNESQVPMQEAPFDSQQAQFYPQNTDPYDPQQSAQAYPQQPDPYNTQQSQYAPQQTTGYNQQQSAQPAQSYMTPSSPGSLTTNPAGSFQPTLPEQPPKKKKTGLIVGIIIAVLVVAGIASYFVISSVIKSNKYTEAVELMDDGKYAAAIQVFEEIPGYKDSDDKLLECKYNMAVDLLYEEDYEAALEIFTELGDYKDCEDQITECNNGITYNEAEELYESGEYADAKEKYLSLGDYKDSESRVNSCNSNLYSEAITLREEGKNEEAKEIFDSLGDYKDSKAYSAYIAECIDNPLYGVWYMNGESGADTYLGFGKDGEGQYVTEKDGTTMYDNFTYSLDGDIITMYVLDEDKVKEVYYFDKDTNQITGDSDNLYMSYTSGVDYYELDPSYTWNFKDFK